MNAFSGTFIWADAQNSDFHSTGSNQFCIRANGGVQLNNDTKLCFGNQIRQMINLYNADYGIGVQNSAEYFRSAGDFYWYQGGIHNDAHGNAGGGIPLMSLNGSGNLTVSGDCAAWGNLSVRGSQVSLGPDALAGGSHALATGDGTRANGSYSTAMGGGTTAAGAYSTTLGFGTSTGSDADSSLAAGATAHANHSGCFTWGDGSPRCPSGAGVTSASRTASSTSGRWRRTFTQPLVWATLTRPLAPWMPAAWPWPPSRG